MNPLVKSCKSVLVPVNHEPPYLYMIRNMVTAKMIEGCCLLAIADKPVVFIDPTRCVGCRSCEIACAIGHSQSKELFKAIKETPRPKPRIHVVYISELGLPSPLNCRHCMQAPCIEVCPTRALYRDEDGAVMLDPLKCIGCLTCGVACPFGIPELDIYNKIMVKCDLCPSRRAEGRPPMCVEACPTGALMYGTVHEVMMKRKESVLRTVFESRKEGVESYMIFGSTVENPVHVLGKKTRSSSWLR